jgi:alginate O-acetyltransferase complex protein AlgI
MFFHSFSFLVFFVAVFAVYWAIPKHRLRMGWLLAASCFFYMSWKPWTILLIVLSASVDYGVALRLLRTTQPWKRRFLLVFSIGVNLGLLGFFKYTNFMLDNIESALDFFGLHSSLKRLDLFLPLGISFYTFETISYVVDVYRGKTQPVRSLLDYALYIMFFPHLIAGPIVRPQHFLPQIARRKTFHWTRMQVGFQLVLRGLFKKALLADSIAPLVDAVFSQPRAYGSSGVWLAVFGYAAQIYCDFSGYSDMAIGLAHMLGFKLAINFNLPYLSADIGEFWRRWHISLSSWLRDYLYIPLGGSHGSRWSTLRNLFLTMLLGGFWHGASWTFVFWGGYHGLLLALNRLFPLPSWLRQGPGRILAVTATFLCVCIGWVFFRAQSLSDAGAIFTRMFRPMHGQSLDHFLTLAVLVCLGTLALSQLSAWFVQWWKWERRLPAPVLGMVLAVAITLLLSLMPMARMTFIYFQF